MEAACQPKTLQEAIIYFADPDNCLKYLAAKRWPKGVVCPTCGGQNGIFLDNQRRWKCRENHDKRQFSVKVGTLDEFPGRVVQFIMETIDDYTEV